MIKLYYFEVYENKVEFKTFYIHIYLLNGLF